MHVIVIVNVLYSLAYILEVALYHLFRQLTKAKLDLITQSAKLCVFQNHISHILILVIVVVQEPYNIWMVELMMNVDLLFGVFIDLYYLKLTIFIATTYFVSVFLANLTFPYDPSPAILTLPS